ncbi:MAG: nucleotidyltransferase family protein [Nanoarchaeota archaeon]
MKCVILCGGYATRLYPMTLTKPKALLEVDKKPLVNHIIESIPDEIKEIYIVTNDKFYNDFVWWLQKQPFKDRVEILNDGTNTNETSLGGIGDLWFAINEKEINEDILVILGDNYFNFYLDEVIDFFNKFKKCVVALFDVKSLEEAKKFGVIEVENNKVVSFEEKPGNPKSTLISTGIYVFSKEEIVKIGKYIESHKPKDGPGFLVKDFSEKDEVYGILLKGFWFDIGDIKTYNEVNGIK